MSLGCPRLAPSLADAKLRLTQGPPVWLEWLKAPRDDRGGAIPRRRERPWAMGRPQAAARHDWPEELVKRALALGAQPGVLVMQIESGIRADQAERFISQQERIRDAAATGQPALDLSWMRVPTEWGIRARVSKKGLTVGALNVGTYGDIPDEWPYQTEMPRGAYPISGVPAMGYSIYEKAELWAENVADLYEEAIQRRWRPATDIPWDTVQALPDEIERSLCQICTYLCEKALLVGGGF